MDLHLADSLTVMNVRKGESMPSIGSEKNDGTDNSSIPSCSSRSSRRNLEGIMTLCGPSKKNSKANVIGPRKTFDFLAEEETLECMRKSCES